MNKLASVSIRIATELKGKTEDIFHRIGLSATDAVRLFYTQVYLNNGLPFEVKIPNQETIKAIRELEAGKGEKCSSIDKLWQNL